MIYRNGMLSTQSGVRQSEASMPPPYADFVTLVYTIINI